MLPDDSRDAAILFDITAACTRIIEFAYGLDRASFERNSQAVSAVQYQIAVLGKAVKRLSPEFRTAHPEVPWRKIAGMRDWVIHAYDNVDLDELWNTATSDVPRLLGQVSAFTR